MRKARRQVPIYEEVDVYTKKELKDALLVKLFRGGKWSAEREKQVVQALGDAFDRCDILHLCQLLDLVPFNAELDTEME